MGMNARKYMTKAAESKAEREAQFKAKAAELKAERLQLDRDQAAAWRHDHQ